jgi:membrane-associated phospholipid phosphatase
MDERFNKIALFLLAVFLNSFGYTGAQILRPNGVLVMTWIDSMIPFVPQFIVAYALYFPVALLPFFLYWKDYKAYKTMALSLAAVLAIAIIIFLVFQTSITRADVDPQKDIFNWGVWQVYQWDAPLNALPSLHVAIPTIATLFVYLRNRKLGLAILPITIAIILSTVFIKQHAILDVLAGLVLAFAIFKARHVFESKKNKEKKEGKKKCSPRQENLVSLSHSTLS